MNPLRTLVRLAALAALATALPFTAGCKDDKPTQPSTPPALSTLWPNEDGRFWSHGGTMDVWGTGEIPLTPAPPGPLPSLTVLARLAAERTFPTPTSTSALVYRLQFADSITTASGVRRQNLAESLTADPALGAFAATATRPGAAFLRRLAIARPDLRSRIARDLGVEATTSVEPLQPLLLHGGAWEKTSEWIGTYGDLDQALAWKFLTSDLRTGTEFVHQLVPSLAADVYLRARVLGTRTVETPAGRYTNAIEVFYVIDYGVSEATDSSGNTLGYAHVIGYGSTHYVPGIGPVKNYERVLSAYGPEGLDPGYGEIRFLLGATGFTS